MALRGPSRGISLFPWAREGAGSRQDAPPIRRRVKLRYIRDALRGRASLIPLRCPLAHRRGIAIPGPFGSANRAASSKPARFFRRRRRFAAFLFPTKPASLGFCGGPYRLRRKEKALFDGVKRKRLGGGIPDFVRNARSACYGGFGLAIADGSDHSTTYAVSLVGGIQGYPLLLFSLPHPGCWGEIGGRGASGYSLLLFCCRSPVVAGGWRWGASGCSLLLFLLPQSGGCGRLEMWAERFRECRGAAAKRGRRCIRAGPGIPLMS